MKRFNGGKDINSDLKHKIWSFFEYKWKNDHNAAIDDEDEIAILTQLPEFVSNKLLIGFLFGDFMYKYTVFFKIKRG